jgi:homoserine kinase
VRVVVPGSSANLGPGFDAVGLALDLTDEVVVEALEPGRGACVEVEGEGAAAVPSGRGAEEHLVVRSLRTALRGWGVDPADQPGLRLRCRNGVPHGRGVGSSAAAVVAGVVAAGALLERAPGTDDLVDTASALEGHPDNAAASLLGGITLGWHDGGPAPAGRWRAVRLEPHPGLRPLLCVPGVELSTARARAMLPVHVPHTDAAFTAGRAALLVEALTRRPELLLEATEDRLHQHQRAAAMPETWRLVTDLRAAGHAAVVSGAGPSVLVLAGPARSAGPGAAEPDAPRRTASLAGHGWRVLEPGIAHRGASAEALPDPAIA